MTMYKDHLSLWWLRSQWPQAMILLVLLMQLNTTHLKATDEAQYNSSNFFQHPFSLRFNFTFNGLVWFPFWNVSPQIYDRVNVLLTLGSSVGLYMVRQKTGQTNSQTICSRGVHCTGSQHIKHLQRKHDEQKLQKHNVRNYLSNFLW